MRGSFWLRPGASPIEAPRRGKLASIEASRIERCGRAVAIEDLRHDANTTEDRSITNKMLCISVEK
jgi:hypothetical protein